VKRRHAAGAIFVLALGACSLQTAFQRSAGSAAAVLYAAAETQRAFHGGRLSDRYATAAFASYRETMPAPADVLAAAGAPAPDARRRLSTLLRPAEQDLSEPCLGSECDWRGQVRELLAAAKALQDAAGG
jgi:hypothetical protein